MQTILNIVGNAVKFTKEGHISITASVAKSDSLRDPRDPEFYPIANVEHFYLPVQVKDTGCGISPQDLPHLFTKFTRSQNGANKGCGGSVLGLTICKSMLKQNIPVNGASENSNGHLHQIVPVNGPSNGDADISGARALFKDENRLVPSRLLY